MVHEQNMDTHNVFGVRRELFPDFARFCLAWHVYAYFNTPRIRPSAQNQRPAVDVVFLGGPFVFRREQIVARFLTLYHDLVELPLAYTTREPHDGEVDGLQFLFVAEDAFAAWTRAASSSCSRTAPAAGT